MRAPPVCVRAHARVHVPGVLLLRPRRVYAYVNVSV